MEESYPDTAPVPRHGIEVLVLEPNEDTAGQIVSALAEAVPDRLSALANSLAEAQQLVADQEPDLFVLDLDASYDMGQEFLYDLRTSHPGARAIILTATHFTAGREMAAGLGAIHFLEKPFPRADFITLVEALLSPAAEGERFQGTLSDLHFADIVQLKCISGATSMLEFTGPRGEKARVYFEDGQVRHAVTPGKTGVEAFNEIIGWKGGTISEVAIPPGTPHTIAGDWQLLLMESVRNLDETRGGESVTTPTPPRTSARRKIVVIDDSMMLVTFVKDVLEEQDYDVLTAFAGEEGIALCQKERPDLVLLDYVLPDMKGDEVCRRLLGQESTARIPIVYMSGFGAELESSQIGKNVIGSLSKPFASEALIKKVKSCFAAAETEAASIKESNSAQPVPKQPTPSLNEVATSREEPAFPTENSAVSRETVEIPSEQTADWSEEVGTPREIAAVPSELPSPSPEAAAPFSEPSVSPREVAKPSAQIVGSSETVAASEPDVSQTDDQKVASEIAPEPTSSDLYFSGDSSFFSIHWALETIARDGLTGRLRAFCSDDSVDLLARDGRVVLVTTPNPSLYCDEAPVTLLNVAPEEVDKARERQQRDGCPLFLTLASSGLILREPALQLLQHYGQKLFARLWAAERVRFAFQQEQLPDYTIDLTASKEEMDQWALGTLRFLQYQELDEKRMVDGSAIPAYTCDGYERIQHLRLTVAEAQFASQFNGSRSVAQISKNLRLDIKFARLTLFRFLALEIVECWPAQIAAEQSKRGGLLRMFGR